MKLSIVIAMAALLFPALASAGDAAAGKAKTAICASCHGLDGKATIPNYPNLAGQNEAYLVAALKAYQDGQRTSANAQIMAPMAKMLSATDVENVAAYYSSLK